MSAAESEVEAGWHLFDEDVTDYSMCVCGVPAMTHHLVYPDDGGGAS